MKMFADTGSWAAIFDRTDPWHQRAVAAFDSWLTEATSVYTSDYVIAETITFLVSHRSHHVAVEFGRSVRRSPNVRVVHVDEELWRGAWELFQRYDDKEFSFTDCTSFVIMREFKLIDVFGFDHHFEQMGFRLWPR